MTKAIIGDRILKDSNGDVRSHHLQSHTHLTNFIHLKKRHVHNKHYTPMPADKALMRDLTALRRSRSLKDPSATPPSWDSSPSLEEGILERPEKTDALVCRRHEDRRMLVPQSSHRIDGARDSRRIKKEGVEDGVKTVSEESEDDDVAAYRNRSRGIDLSSSRGRRHRFRGTGRRKKPSLATVDGERDRNYTSMAPKNSHAFNGSPENGCGIPLHWSKIHDRGKSFLDKAGRSLSCGMSEARQRDFSGTRVTPCRSGSSTSSDGEELPLLFDADSARIFADNLLRREKGFDSGDGHGFRRHGNNKRHQSITQKYAPRTFEDVIGQNLVVQALSNAVSKGKIGSFYAFYGPRGTGKTACARIFSRALICRSQDRTKACGVCDSCIEKSHNVREIGGQITNLGLEGITQFLSAPKRRSQYYKVLIVEDCDFLTPRSWRALLEAFDRAPKHDVVLVLVCSSLSVLPHAVVSRCRRFFFPKLKDSDIIRTLEYISTKEGLEIDRDALKLIASRSDGSLRDAEMTVEQLSLLGQKISLQLVQELVGHISEEKLVDLLDFALSADTVNTVKNLRDITETGVEPLTLVSQLATAVTDILAGSCDLARGASQRKFFRRQALTKEDVGKLRKALKTLSEAEKQVRLSHDGMTWLTAALLQLAPEQQFNSPPVLNKDGNFHNVHRGDKFRRSGKGHVGVQGSQTNKAESREIVEILFESGEEDHGKKQPVLLPSSTRSYSNRDVRRSLENAKKSSEIVELEASPPRDEGLSLVKRRVSLAQVLQQAEGSPQQHEGKWSKRKAFSIAKKLEKDNLSREPRSRRLLCWNATKRTCRKLSRWKVRTRRPKVLLKFISCGRGRVSLFKIKPQAMSCVV